MNPKYAPYKCPCGIAFWDEYSFGEHLKECPDAREFIKCWKHYNNTLKKHIVDEEALR